MKRRIVFNIATFLESLQQVLTDNPDMIDDEVQRYKDFLGHTQEPLRSEVIRYTTSHYLVKEHKRLRSFISACHSEF